MNIVTPHPTKLEGYAEWSDLEVGPELRRVLEDTLTSRVYPRVISTPFGTLTSLRTMEESFWYMTGLLDVLSHIEEGGEEEE